MFLYGLSHCWFACSISCMSNDMIYIQSYKLDNAYLQNNQSRIMSRKTQKVGVLNFVGKLPYLKLGRKTTKTKNEREELQRLNQAENY
jgi:hypothetical protein